MNNYYLDASYSLLFSSSLSSSSSYSDLLIHRLTHTQTYSYSFLIILTYSYSDLPILRPTHIQTFSLSDLPNTQQIVRMSLAGRWFHHP